jgi:hypothetical protein
LVKFLLGALLVLFCTLAATPASAETRALLIGVSRYQSPVMPDLRGPANDLTAMEGLLRGMGAADVTTLRDAQVTRTSVETALQALGRRAAPGDWILLYYSGHGAQAAARARSADDGAYDQFVPLAGFDPARQDPERFIVDKDFYAWLKVYVPAEARVLMLVDSCHSGSMYRSVDPRSFAFASRLAFRGTDTRAIELVARPGPRLPAIQPNAAAAIAAEQRDDLANLVYIGASRDDQLALETELPQEGAPQRGVLTFAFEQGLTSVGANDSTPAADLDGDGTVTIVEMSSYLNSQVRLLSAQRQESTAYFPSAWSELPVLATSFSPRPPLPPLPPAVRIVGGADGQPNAAANPLWRISSSPADADFIWDRRKGDVVRRSGDVVASQVATPAAFAGVIEKWDAIRALQPLVSELPAIVAVKPNGSDYVYGPGTPVILTLSRTGKGLGKRYATVFNLASDGTIQLLYPLITDGEGLLPDAGLTVLETQIVAPFGVDHIVAITSPEEMDGLRAALRSASEQRAAGRVISLIRGDLRRARGRASLSIAELYTGL